MESAFSLDYRRNFIDQDALTSSSSKEVEENVDYAPTELFSAENGEQIFNLSDVDYIYGGRSAQSGKAQVADSRVSQSAAPIFASFETGKFDHASSVIVINKTSKYQRHNVAFSSLDGMDSILEGFELPP